MKTRNEFVTNSISSSFVLEIAISLKNGKVISYREWTGHAESAGNDMSGVIDAFGEKLKENITDIKRIKKITLKRKWRAWGEASSCFGSKAYLEYYDKELLKLAKSVCKSQGEAKEEAKAALIEYLAHNKNTIEGGWETAKFPTGFLGANVDYSIFWEKYTDSIEKLAGVIASGKLYTNTDYGIESTVIDMKDHSIEHKAEYYLEKPL